MARRFFIAGNWKMYKTAAEGREFMTRLTARPREWGRVDTVIFARATILPALKGFHTAIAVGAQNMYCEEQGAFTGEISPVMVREFAEYILIGHSERRELFGEDDGLINRKLIAAWKHGIKPVLCVGETLSEREAGATFVKIDGQLDRDLAGLDAREIAGTIVAYEPIWAIGTGRNATPAQAQEVHAHIRSFLAGRIGASAGVRILYGGSVKPDNCRELLSQPDIDGLLIGGASLNPDHFSGIIDTSLIL
jgi:triosephosphate isomerase (TIM)